MIKKARFTNVPVKNYRNGAVAITNAYSHRTAIKPAVRRSASTNRESPGSIFQAGDPNIILSPSSSSIGKLGAPPTSFAAMVIRSGRVTFAGTLIPRDDTRPIAHSLVSSGHWSEVEGSRSLPTIGIRKLDKSLLRANLVSKDHSLLDSDLVERALLNISLSVLADRLGEIRGIPL